MQKKRLQRNKPSDLQRYEIVDAVEGQMKHFEIRQDQIVQRVARIACVLRLGKYALDFVVVQAENFQVAQVDQARKRGQRVVLQVDGSQVLELLGNTLNRCTEINNFNATLRKFQRLDVVETNALKLLGYEVACQLATEMLLGLVVLAWLNRTAVE